MKIKEMEYGKESRTELLCKDKYKNYTYYVLNLGTHPTAYIEISKEDKLYEKSYEEIYRIGCDIDVNGGLTYSDNELMGIKSESWFIGWDYAHLGDYCGYEEDMPESVRTYGKKWTTEEIIEECKNAIDQIIEFENKEILEEEPRNIEVCGSLFTRSEYDKLAQSEEQKKIPEKLDEYIYTDSLNYNQCNYMFEKLINKYNEIIDYLKSKGE